MSWSVAEYTPSCVAGWVPPPAMSWNVSGGRFDESPVSTAPNPRVKFELFRWQRPFAYLTDAPRKRIVALAGPQSISTLTPLIVPGCGHIAVRRADVGAAASAKAASETARPVAMPIGCTGPSMVDGAHDTSEEGGLTRPRPGDWRRAPEAASAGAMAAAGAA